jgi:heme/copper-type cytochrome/quinol oxidase subunit 1
MTLSIFLGKQTRKPLRMRRIPQRWFLWTAAFFLALQTFFTLFFGNSRLELANRDTYFVFSASWLLMLLAGQMLFMAVIYWMFDEMKRPLHIGLGKTHFFMTLFALWLFSVGLFESGFFDNYRPQQRIDGALFDYKLLNKYNIVSGFVLFFAQIIFVINCLFALFIRPKRQNINKSLRDYFK